MEAGPRKPEQTQPGLQKTFKGKQCGSPSAESGAEDNNGGDGRSWHSVSTGEANRVSVVMLMNLLVVLTFLPLQEHSKPLHVSAVCDREENVVSSLLEIPDQCSSIYSCEQTNISENRTSSALIPGICKNPLIAARTCTLFLWLILSLL